jgi:rubrerythrin
VLTIELLDRDGALQEAAAHVGSRADLLRVFTAAGAALLATALVPDEARAADAGDVDILNYALTLEYLQSSFYTEAERLGALSGRTARAARTVGAVERAHVRALRKVLGRSAVKRPLFNFGGVTEAQRAFLQTAVAFEDLAVAAYKGQAARIEAKPLLAAAVSIHSVEARHAAWMRHLFGIVPAERAFDDALSRAEVERIVASTRFVASTPTTATGGGSPDLTG